VAVEGGRCDVQPLGDFPYGNAWIGQQGVGDGYVFIRKRRRPAVSGAFLSPAPARPLTESYVSRVTGFLPVERPAKGALQKASGVLVVLNSI
jgi:hypothetical protein